MRGSGKVVETIEPAFLVWPKVALDVRSFEFDVWLLEGVGVGLGHEIERVVDRPEFLTVSSVVEPLPDDFIANALGPEHLVQQVSQLVRPVYIDMEPQGAGRREQFLQ